MHHRISSHTAGLLFAPGLVLLAAAFVQAQGAKESDPLANVSMEELEKDMGKYRSKYNDLFRGTTSLEAGDQEQVNAIDTAARYTLYRFYDSRIQKPGPRDISIDRVFQEFEDMQLKEILKNKEKNTGVAQLFTKKVIEHAKLVLQTPRPKGPIAHVNAAHVLERLTKLGQPELADALLEILNQQLQYDAAPAEWKRNDGVKLYVLRGLGEMLALQDQNPPGLNNGQEQKIILALVQFIERKTEPLLGKGAPAEEIDGWRALRREAVRALANGRLAALPNNDKTQPGLLLLRVMARDGVTPEPRMDERLEAAIGVARLSPERTKTYQQEYAAYQLGLFVDALAGYAGQAKEEQKPMKVYAARLLDALDGMRTPTNKDTVGKIVNETYRLLRPLETSGTTVDLATQRNTYGQWMTTNLPKKDSLFEGVKDATVKPANRPEDEAPEK